MRAHLLPLLLSGCIEIERPTDSGTTASTYSGWERYQLGMAPDALNCDLFWDVTGTPTLQSCPQCVFTFDLSFVMDDIKSENDGTCHTAQETFSATYVLIEESGTYSVGTWDGAEVSVFGAADFDASTGRFSYTTGNAGYTYGAYYYTQYTVGYGRVE